MCRRASARSSCFRDEISTVAVALWFGGGKRLRAGIVVGKGTGGSGPAFPAIETVRADGTDIIEAGGPIGVHVIGVVMCGQADGLVNLARQGTQRYGLGHRPTPAGRGARQ